jgi:hypothetical protein
MNLFPCLIRSSTGGGECRFALGDPLVDSYLAFVAGRCRLNTLRAVAHDLKTFFSVIDKAPVEVVAADIFNFVAHQRGDRSVVRISDGESGLSARTVARLPADRQTPRPRTHRQDPPSAPLPRHPYGHRVMTAALALHDDQFPHHYLAA